MMRRLITLLTLGLTLAVGLAGAVRAELVMSSCVQCHSDSDLFEGEDLAIAQAFADDVHAKAGLSCNDCHGGNADGSTADDMDAAMDPNFEGNPYRGVPERKDIPSFCGRCHSDPTYMKRFRPDFRVDQEAEYRTSQHGRALANGDEDAATCVSCHGVHGILSVKDTASPVYPTRVAETCRGCHSNADTMAGHTLADGSAMPVDQYENWALSVHAEALAKGDISAPTCNDCHGNHGAVPPGLESVALVCGQCHGREAELFRASPKYAQYQDHNLNLIDAEDGCRNCHEAPEPAALVTLNHFTECTVCHGNHAVLRPTVAMLGSLPATPCAFCHEGESPLDIESERIQLRYEEELSRLMNEAEAHELEGDMLFDWLVDRAVELEPHSTTTPDRETGSTLRPEFAKLFAKFRIGKTHHASVDSTTGQSSTVRVVQCTMCHGSAGVAPSEPLGRLTALTFLESMHELTSSIARAERVILAARRGGVEVGEAQLDLDRAVGSQVELEVLVHTFDADTSGVFYKKQREGMEHAHAALVAGQAGLQELGSRRKGMAVILALTLFVLFALALKIRQIDESRW